MSGSGGRAPGSPALARVFARYLAQREELGERELVLGELRAAEALEKAARGKAENRPLPGTDSPQRSAGMRSGAILPTIAPAADDAAAGTGLPGPSLSRKSVGGPGAGSEGGAPGEEPGGSGWPEWLPPDHEGVRTIALGCTRCDLSETRTQVVFSDGPPDARLLVIGEGPGQQEDLKGLPFVGPAGRFLDLLLESVGFSRERDTYICNVVKCRPPGNRNPLPAEIEACAPYLRAQVALVRPRAILAVGTFAAQWVTGSGLPLGKLRGSVYSYEGVPAVATYHPAALLRNGGWTRGCWEDLQLLRTLVDAD